MEVPVKLVTGNNRFYVMASRTGDYDSCSRVVEVDYEAPMERGQVHVVALGWRITRPAGLGFARDDAEQLQRVSPWPGTRRRRRPRASAACSSVPTSTVENVRGSFDEIARRVEDRPQDTVVVFLAGHTGVFDPQRFCLLLPTYPFLDTEPTLVAARDAPQEER